MAIFLNVWAYLKELGGRGGGAEGKKKKKRV